MYIVLRLKIARGILIRYSHANRYEFVTRKTQMRF